MFDLTGMGLGLGVVADELSNLVHQLANSGRTDPGAIWVLENVQTQYSYNPNISSPPLRPGTPEYDQMLSRVRELLRPYQTGGPRLTNPIGPAVTTVPSAPSGSTIPTVTVTPSSTLFQSGTTNVQSGTPAGSGDPGNRSSLSLSPGLLLAGAVAMFLLLRK